MTNKQELKSGNDSTNIQAGGNVSIGISYTEAKEISLETFEKNSYKLAEIANKTVMDRVEEITEKTLKRLLSENPSGFSKLADPSFQYSFIDVQKEYAKTGDQDLGDLLIDLLIDGSKQDRRDILQIVLSESLKTAPKLTNDQLSALALIFILKHTVWSGALNHKLLGEYFDKFIFPFVDKLNYNSISCYQHLEFSGCGTISLGEISLEKLISQSYQGMFLKGFDPIEITNRKISIELKNNNIFIKCFNDPSKFQIRATNKTELDKIFESNNVDNDDRTKILALFDQYLMSDEEIIKTCVSIRPYLQPLFSIWASSDMKSFNLTSVGMAIGHANVKRFSGEFTDLSVWIN